MKSTVNVECSPEEARRFMGLPDVTPINEQLVAEMGKRMEANLKLMSGESLMSSWMSVGAQAQDAFVKLMTSGVEPGFLMNSSPSRRIASFGVHSTRPSRSRASTILRATTIETSSCSAWSCSYLQVS